MRVIYYSKLIRNILRVGLKKIRHNNKLVCSPFQLWGTDFSTEISRDGRIKIGKKMSTRDGVHLIAQGGTIDIGENVFCNYNVCITALESIMIGDNVTIANNVVIVDHDHSKHGKDFVSKPVVIGAGAWIGANAVILKGVKIGEKAIIAAGSIVTKDVPNGVVVAGVPARIVH